MATVLVFIGAKDSIKEHPTHKDCAVKLKALHVIKVA